MFSHITIGTNDLEKATAFYDAVLATLGQKRFGQGDWWSGYGDFSDGIGIGTLWVLKPSDGQPAAPGNGTNIAFLAHDRASVDAFHVAALVTGGTDEGAPGVRAENHANFYACYIRDRDGNKLLAVCHTPPGEED